MARQPYYDPKNGQVQNGGCKPLYDYDNDEFYSAVEQLARNGARDREIAVGLKNLIGLRLSPEEFSRMKHGKYENWDDEENKRRGSRLTQVLADARDDVNRVVKAVYLSTALGKQKYKTVTTLKKRLKIDGELTDNEEIQTSETVYEIPPNMQAMATWLYHHDEDWRKIQRGMDSVSTGDVPDSKEVKQGVSITSWLDQEMLMKGDN